MLKAKGCGSHDINPVLWSNEVHPILPTESSLKIPCFLPKLSLNARIVCAKVVRPSQEFSDQGKVLNDAFVLGAVFYGM